jgi:hypothetical protein
MAEHWCTLRVEVADDEIVVSLPGSFYSVTYYKPEASPQLLGKSFPKQDGIRVPLPHADFLVRAWKLANAKARELGWIV